MSTLALPSSYPTSEHSSLRRHPERGTSERETVLTILQEGSVCQLSWVAGERPIIIPMGYGLVDNEIVLHGSLGSRLMKTVSDGREVCVSVTHLDGLVLARSAFHSSMNYRSVVVFGTGRRLESRADKRRALDGFVEQLVPGRTEVARPMTDQEVDGTMVVAIEIQEASAKVRSGPPKEPEGDVDFPVWAGVIPLSLEYGVPEPAPDLTSDDLPLVDEGAAVRWPVSGGGGPATVVRGVGR